MEYTVEIRDDNNILLISYHDLSEKEAKDIAAIEAAKPENKDNQVFVKFFRRSDGQHGYLNRDGHSPVGKAW